MFTLNRPRSYWDVVGFHLPLAWVTGMALLLSYAVPIQYLPIQTCAFLGMTGCPCPFCGFTRSFWAISGGEWGYALQNCPFAGVVYMGTLLVFAWNWAGLWVGVQIRRGPMLKLNSRQYRGLCYLLCLLLTMNWAYRLAYGLA